MDERPVGVDELLERVRMLPRAVPRSSTDNASVRSIRAAPVTASGVRVLWVRLL
jgi:hypothetical protein